MHFRVFSVPWSAAGRFLNEDDGLQMAFLDGNQPERLLAPMKSHIEARGGEVRFSLHILSFNGDFHSTYMLSFKGDFHSMYCH